MDANQVAAITAIAALLTGLATLYSIYELRVKRRVQHRPEIVAEDVHFRALRLKGDHTPPIITLEAFGSAVPKQDGRRGHLPISLRNVGTGAARDVTVTWSHDSRQFAELLAPYDDAIGGRVWVDGKTVELAAEGGPRWFTTGNSESRLGTILPMPVGQEKVVSLDFGYGGLLCAFFAAASTPDGREVLEAPLPALSLNLSYRDIEGLRYAKSLQLQFELLVMVPSGWADDDSHDEIAQGYLRVVDA
jgi:hypothetical protein